MAKLRLLFYLVALAITSHKGFAQGIITTIAGNGITQYIGDGYPATNLSLAIPCGICIDKKGAIYIANRRDSRIRKLYHDTLFTLAGNGFPGYTGNGGQAESAQVDQPVDICRDTAGNLFIAEFNNHVIREIDGTTGVIGTVCGNTTPTYAGDGLAAVSASLNMPNGACLDAQGNLYIADFGNQRIRKVTKADGLISTFAGDGTAAFGGDGGPATAASVAYPTGVAADSAGNIFIADYGNNAIRRVDAITGIITTVAGTTAAGYTGDGGPATAATMIGPLYVHVDRKGNLLVIDEGNNVVREIATNGNIYTVAGSGTVGYSGDGGPAIAAAFWHLTSVTTDDSGYMYIADGGNSVIRKVTPGYLSVRQPLIQHEVTAFPNPSAGVCTIQMPVATTAIMKVTDFTGKTVAMQLLEPGANRLDLLNMPAGVYILFITMQGDTIVLKHSVLH